MKDNSQKKPKNVITNRRTLGLLLTAVVLAVLIIVILVVHKGSSAPDDKVRIMIDAGHGGDNSGMQALASEDEFDEKVTDLLVQKLSDDSDFEVLRTHETGTAMSVKDRAAVINEEKPDIVLSVHCASNPDSSLSGTRIFADIPSSRYHDESLKLADALKSVMEEDGDPVTEGYFYYHPIKDGSVYQEQIAAVDDTTDYQEDTFDLMMQSEAPVVLVQQMYVTNQADVDKWNNDEGYEKAAQLYYDAIKSVYEQ